MLNKWKRQGLRGRVYAKRARSFDGGSSKCRLEIQHNPRFKKRISNQVRSNFPNQVFQMSIQRRTNSMISSLEVNKRLPQMW